MSDLAHLTEVARRAVPYGLATVDLQRILVSFALDPASPEFKAPLNGIHHSRSLADPSDRSVVNLNVDTPYSYAWLDLRSGPVLLTMPAHDPDRYMSAQVVDLYSYIVGYVSPRTTGCDGGTYLVQGPSAGTPDVAGRRGARVPDRPVPGAGAHPALRRRRPAERRRPAGRHHGGAARTARRRRWRRRPRSTCGARSTASSCAVLTWMLELMPRLPEDAAIRRDLAALGAGTGRPRRRSWPTTARGEALTGRTPTGDAGRDGPLRDRALLGRAVRQPGVLRRRPPVARGRCVPRHPRQRRRGVPRRRLPRRLARAALRRHPRLRHPVRPGRPATGGRVLVDHPLRRRRSTCTPTRSTATCSAAASSTTMHRDADGGLTLHVRHTRPPRHLVANWLPAPAGARTASPSAPTCPAPAIRSGAWTAPPVVRTHLTGVRHGQRLRHPHPGRDRRRDQPGTDHRAHPRAVLEAAGRQRDRLHRHPAAHDRARPGAGRARWPRRRRRVRRGPRRSMGWVFLALGALLLVMGIKNWRNRKDTSEPAMFAKVTGLGPAAVAFLAFGAVAVNPKNTVLLLTAGQSIGAASSPWLVGLGFVLVATLPYTLSVGLRPARRGSGQRAARPDASLAGRPQPPHHGHHLRPARPGARAQGHRRHRLRLVIAARARSAGIPLILAAEYLPWTWAHVEEPTLALRPVRVQPDGSLVTDWDARGARE